MSIIFIGDRGVGKTALAVELTNPLHEYIQVTNQDYEFLCSNRALAGDQGRLNFSPTAKIETNFLDIEARLTVGKRQFSAQWIDTPGEIWRTDWQTDNSPEWKGFLAQVQGAQGVLLVLPPHRNMIRGDVNPEYFITQQQWCNRFERWVNFFKLHCPRVRHLALCLNKADLFCDLNDEAATLAYGSQPRHLNWLQRHQYVSYRYFFPLMPQLETLNQSLSGLSARCFITSLYNRSLLELPWIYLASYLAD
jgi:hypothetical protein